MHAPNSVAPPLARALAARLQAASGEPLDGDAFASLVTCVAQLDAADRAYLDAIAAEVAAGQARTVLDAVAAFRERVAVVRDRLREATGYADFDPLDSYAPPATGSHADYMRTASASDTARAEIAHLRAQLNERLAGALDRHDVERVVEAKRARNAAFDRAVRAALPPRIGDKLATALLLLVDGWY